MGRKTKFLFPAGFTVIMDYAVNPGATIYEGGLVAVNSSGMLVEMTAATGLKCVGTAWFQYGSIPPNMGIWNNTATSQFIGASGLDTTTFYGSSATLGSLTLIVTVNGTSATTTFSSTLASKAALLTAVNSAINTALSTSGVVYATQGGGGGILIAGTTVVLGAGTANTLLGLSNANGLRLQTRRGPQFFKNSATNPCLVADLNAPVYCADDQTVQSASGGASAATSSPVGILLSVVTGLEPGEYENGPGCWVDAGCAIWPGQTVVNGTTITGNPTTSGQTLTSTAANAAHWA
jgi:hypothetical protein